MPSGDNVTTRGHHGKCLGRHHYVWLTTDVHSTQINQWKKQLLDSAPSLVDGRHTKAVGVDVDELYKKSGKLEMERDF